MDLWIRSQDKLVLIKTTSLEIDEQENPVIYARNEKGLLVLVGQYNTMKRALEVLDEINKMLMINFSFCGAYQDADIKVKKEILRNLYKIYTMPEK